MGYSLASSIVANTGVIDSDVQRGNPLNLIIGSASFTTTDLASSAAFTASMKAKFQLSSTSTNKLFPLPVIQGNSDKTVAAKEATLGYGLILKLLRSKAGYELDILTGSSLEKKLIKYDGKQVPLFIFDDQNNVWGKKDNAGNFAGVKYQVSVEPRGHGDAQNAKTTKIQISIVDARDFTENAYAVASNLSSTDLVGLCDAVLSEAAASTTNVRHIQAIVDNNVLTSHVNVFDYFSTLMANASMWVATNIKTGAAVSITGVVVGTNPKSWDVTLDSTAFTALTTGDTVSINFAAPDVLAAAGITGTEGVAVIITK